MSCAAQVRSAGAQQAVQQEVEKLQVQNGAAAGLAPPKTEPGDVDARLGRELPPAKVACISFVRIPLPFRICFDCECSQLRLVTLSCAELCLTACKKIKFRMQQLQLPILERRSHQSISVIMRYSA